MASNKSKKTSTKKSNNKSSKPAASKKTKEVKNTTPEVEVIETVEETVEVTATTGNPLKGFFACKHDEKENILTIFKSPRIYGAILGELFGTMILTMILLSLGLYQPLYVMFGMIAITAAIYGISGANLNPVITAGMMATRRISAIRGVLYMLAQILGAWLAFVVTSAFHGVGGESANAMTTVVAGDGDQFWIYTMIEFVGAIIAAFFFARAVAYRKNPLVFATIVGAGACVALLFVIMISGYAGLQNNFALNPAAALTFQILPSQGEFGELIGEVALTLTTYWIFPLIGGIIGFFVSDTMSRLSGECACCKKCEGKK